MLISHGQMNCLNLPSVPFKTNHKCPLFCTFAVSYSKGQLHQDCRITPAAPRVWNPLSFFKSLTHPFCQLLTLVAKFCMLQAI